MSLKSYDPLYVCLYMQKLNCERQMEEDRIKSLEKITGKQEIKPKKQQIRTYNKTSEQEAEKELKTIAKNFQKENNKQNNNYSRNKNKK
jgi:hypothetical protein